jgi:NAD(P)H-dependent FMN reductase
MSTSTVVRVCAIVGHNDGFQDAGLAARICSFFMSPRTLLVVHHTMTGGTAQMAQAAAEGARAEGGDALAVNLLRAHEAMPEHVLAADGYLFCTPENLAAMSGMMKDFFDRCYYPALDRLNGRPYAALVCAGSDGSNAVRQVERIATGWRLRAVAPAVIVCTHAQTPKRILAPKVIGQEDLARCRELGAAMAAGLTLGVF